MYYSRMLATMSNNTARFNETSCHLSPQARAVSTLVSVAAGSIISCITDSTDISLFFLLFSWTSAIRIVMTGVWYIYEASQLHRAEGGDQFPNFYNAIPVLRYLVNKEAEPFWISVDTEPDRGVNVLGWIGWIWATTYVPVMTTMWLVGNWSEAAAIVMFARATSVGVSALPLTWDTKARYGDVLEKYLGKPFRWLLTFISAFACLYLGLLSVLFLCLALAEIQATWKSILMATTYTLVLVTLTFMSFLFQTPHDERLVGPWSSWRILRGLVIGVVVMFIVAGPAFLSVFASPKSPGIGLKEYTACKSVALWRKLIALMP